MFSELKKPLYLCILLLVFSIACTIMSYMLLSDGEEELLFVLCSCLASLVSVLLVIIIALIKKLMEILGAMDSSTSMRIAEMKKDQE